MLLVGDPAGLVDPRRVGVLGQQRSAVPLQRLGCEGRVAGTQGPTGDSGELAYVDLDVVATGEQSHQVLTQDDGVRVVQCAARVVGRFVQPRRSGVRGQAGPQGVDDLFAVQLPAAAERQELHELRRLPAAPDLRRHGYVVAGHTKAAEKLHLDAHRGTPGLPAGSPCGVRQATNVSTSSTGTQGAAMGSHRVEARRLTSGQVVHLVAHRRAHPS